MAFSKDEGRPGLILRSRRPENLESPLGAIDSLFTPNDLFYLRNHHDYPLINLEAWQLTVGGHLEHSMCLSYQQLLTLPQVSIAATLECSGNKRTFFQPKVPGDQWETGALGNAKWTGIPLCHLLSMAKLRAGVRDIVFSGADSGPRADMPGTYHFIRSMPVQDVFEVNPVLAIYMNDQTIPYKHGFPLRLVVPGWYGMASVKWITSITAITSEFSGPFQKIDYVYLPQENSYEKAFPVRKIKVNSVITHPADQAIIYPGRNVIKGIAWAGSASIVKIEVSIDNGITWAAVSSFSKQISQFSWVFWQYFWDVTHPGKYAIKVKAQDNLGNVQPAKAVWNAKGYGNNSIHTIRVHVPKQISRELGGHR